MKNVSTLGKNIKFIRKKERKKEKISISELPKKQMLEDQLLVKLNRH